MNGKENSLSVKQESTLTVKESYQCSFTLKMFSCWGTVQTFFSEQCYVMIVKNERKMNKNRMRNDGKLINEHEMSNWKNTFSELNEYEMGIKWECIVISKWHVDERLNTKWAWTFDILIERPCTKQLKTRLRGNNEYS